MAGADETPRRWRLLDAICLIAATAVAIMPTRDLLPEMIPIAQKLEFTRVLDFHRPGDRDGRVDRAGTKQEMEGRAVMDRPDGAISRRPVAGDDSGLSNRLRLERSEVKKIDFRSSEPQIRFVWPRRNTRKSSIPRDRCDRRSQRRLRSRTYTLFQRDGTFDNPPCGNESRRLEEI